MKNFELFRDIKRFHAIFEYIYVHINVKSQKNIHGKITL